MQRRRTEKRVSIVMSVGRFRLELIWLGRRIVGELAEVRRECS